MRMTTLSRKTYSKNDVVFAEATKLFDNIFRKRRTNGSRAVEEKSCMVRRLNDTRR